MERVSAADPFRSGGGAHKETEVPSFRGSASSSHCPHDTKCHRHLFSCLPTSPTRLLVRGRCVVLPGGADHAVTALLASKLAFKFMPPVDPETYTVQVLSSTVLSLNLNPGHKYASWSKRVDLSCSKCGPVPICRASAPNVIQRNSRIARAPPAARLNRFPFSFRPLCSFGSFLREHPGKLLVCGRTLCRTAPSTRCCARTV